MGNNAEPYLHTFSGQVIGGGVQGVSDQLVTVSRAQQCVFLLSIAGGGGGNKEKAQGHQQQGEDGHCFASLMTDRLMTVLMAIY